MVVNAAAYDNVSLPLNNWYERLDTGKNDSSAGDLFKFSRGKWGLRRAANLSVNFILKPFE
ncbi:unnamed protein product [Clavelina lepadiformis]|uniref:Uncharacterized protein n=1 Tax=Clavelina lepadiformis TaxID=159417 RepID=A0ABP0GXG0_CLALP